MRRIARKDKNHKGIVKSLRALPGVTVFDTASLGDGFPDIIVGYKGKNFLFEIKDGSKPPSQRVLTPDEIEFHGGWKGQVNVCNSFDEIFKIIYQKQTAWKYW